MPAAPSTASSEPSGWPPRSSSRASRASTSATARRNALHVRPRCSDIATSRGSEAVMSSARRIAARSCGRSTGPSTTRRITSSVSACIRGSVRSSPAGQRAASAAASSAIVARQPASASPWKAGSSSRRRRRCSGPWVSRIEVGPANGSSTVELAPPWSWESSAAKIRRMSPGSATSTIGASAHATRTVNGSPWRARQRRRNAVGRATHSTVCSAAGSLGPGGSSMPPIVARATAGGGRRSPTRGRASTRPPARRAASRDTPLRR